MLPLCITVIWAYDRNLYSLLAIFEICQPVMLAFRQAGWRLWKTNPHLEISVYNGISTNDNTAWKLGLVCCPIIGWKRRSKFCLVLWVHFPCQVTSLGVVIYIFDPNLFNPRWTPGIFARQSIWLVKCIQVCFLIGQLELSLQWRRVSCRWDGCLSCGPKTVDSSYKSGAVSFWQFWLWVSFECNCPLLLLYAP